MSKPALYLKFKNACWTIKQCSRLMGADTIRAPSAFHWQRWAMVGGGPVQCNGEPYLARVFSCEVLPFFLATGQWAHTHK